MLACAERLITVLDQGEILTSEYAEIRLGINRADFVIAMEEISGENYPLIHEVSQNGSGDPLDIFWFSKQPIWWLPDDCA